MKTAVITLIGALLGTASPAFAQLTTIAVKGAVTLEVSGVSADVDIVTGDARQVRAEVTDGSIKAVTLEQKGDRVTVLFDARDVLRSGSVKVSVPAGSSLLARSVSGDVSVKGGVSAKVRTTSGDLHISGCDKVDAETVSGDIEIRGASNAEIETVSGDASVTSPDKIDVQARFKTTSGDLEWHGHCGKQCRIDGETLSGELKLFPDASSAFEVAFQSFSGDWNVKTGGGMVVTTDNERSKAARFGTADGKITVETFSGELSITLPKK